MGTLALETTALACWFLLKREKESSVKGRITITLWVVGFFVVMALIPSVRNCAWGFTDTKSSGDKVPTSRTAVVVELFTSEGCSSCPPADKLLSWLDTRQPLEGVDIIPLSEHVDYWNHLGWADPFSDAVFSERQRAYSDSLNSDPYTPQMVVDGKVEFIGSDRDRALEAISREANTPRATVSILPLSPANSSAPNSVSFSVQVEKLPPLQTKKRRFVFLAIAEKNLQSSVNRGENSGRTLTHTAVVRELKVIGKLEAGSDAAFVAHPVVKISSGWKLRNLRAIVFVQLQDSHEILGAAESAFPAL
jgi:hypothetical protein